MLSAEKNARLTQVGADTPGGQLLRRYWHALWPACDFSPEKPKKRIKVMGKIWWSIVVTTARSAA
jgi:hypothetical protein